MGSGGLAVLSLDQCVLQVAKQRAGEIAAAAQPFTTITFQVLTHFTVVRAVFSTIGYYRFLFFFSNSLPFNKKCSKLCKIHISYKCKRFGRYTPKEDRSKCPCL